ncbi:PSD1 and planctomycete cytochrome C domain-containing protein [Planctomyces sp. SH-PL62]|uniref:PSD1 and planctomycete cytochrome C domain-containing protein n=1 Tax=Planctomyces sp. SH-PL62 TaxID=1636152 RepID=UPI00078C66EB|nr:PSD1 and planctomycete cytochrome C domain-containing protein [Planctomyces sp. SH-PL62]AMV37309.1 Planctomycete cytochrome C [Planctomyces sp. SH-PL62]
MRRPGRRDAVRCGALALAVFQAAAAVWAGDDSGRDFFEARVRPVLIENCYPCHSAQAAKSKGGLRLDDREATRAGGDSGPAVTPGRPDESLLIQAVEHADDGEVAPMPPKGKLPDEAIADLRRWIEQGAVDPRDASEASREESSADRWALRPIERPAVPTLDDEARRGSLGPVDAFIRDRLRREGLGPSPEADRRTLIRRLSFDLIGLPPTPEEVRAFVADPASDAYERLVDRLLASPHYGERWARRWMDLAHFAETHGHDQDRIRPNAWPYRDYLVESFNRDKPYARFVREQVAADALYPDEPGLVAALGFLAAGPWDESSLRDIREDSQDRQVGYYLDRDDMVATVMSTFVSSTVHCARCHDHKFDPISQAEYYGLQAVFAGVGRADRAYDTDPAVARLRRESTARRKALAERDPELLDTLQGDAIQAEVEAWGARWSGPRIPWTPLDPSAMKTEAGTILEAQADRSILAGGPTPAEETYTITATTEVVGITAFRLELLPDDRLPSGGPGRNANGNLHLTEIAVFEASSDAPDGWRPAPIATATSDFDQAGWGIAAAIDGDPKTAWGIHPEVGKPHEGVFEFRDEVGRAGGETTLRFVLRQTFPAGHPIGRFRLSVVAAPRPVRVGSLPGSLAASLATPPDRRTPEQRRELGEAYLAETLDRQIAALPPARLVYAAAGDFVPDGSHKPVPSPRPVFVLKRGDIRQPGEPAVPGALGCVAGLEARFDRPGEADRRAELARWLSDPGNPLTWRSIVNRAWQAHFGRGLVDTPSDFGRMGAAPSHPELLDWLAWTFREDGGSLKRLDRLIVTSATYRQASGSDPAHSAVDADNRLLWRMNRSRLDAEAVRDAVLAVSGKLDRTMGGPSIRHFELGAAVHVTPTVDYTAYDWDAPGSGRRGVYRFLFRTLPDPFMDVFDAADASQLTPTRNASVTPLQALAMLNDPFVIRQSEHFAHRLESLADDPESRVRAAFTLALGREPDPDEVREWAEYASHRGTANFCRMLLNTSEFLFVD